MSTVPLYPLRFKPILRRLIWGGRRLGTVLHKPIGDESDYAESWEISDYHDQVSIVEEGSLAGSTIRDLIRARGGELLGRALGPRDQFPLLVKFIDAHETLSVQVHPDDEQGRRLANDNGKTETWVILDAEPGSVIYAGLKRGVGPDELAEGDPVRRGRAFAPPLRAPTRRLHPDRGRHSARDRRRGAPGRDSGDVRRHIPGLRLGTPGRRRQAPTASYSRGAGIDRFRPRAGRPDHARAPSRSPAAAPASGWRDRSTLPSSGSSLNRPTSVGTLDRFTIVMGLSGSCGCRARRRVACGSISARRCCSPRHWASARSHPTAPPWS